jgi:hypothetical protein
MSGSDSWRANICFDCLRRLLSLSRFAGPISGLVSSPWDLAIKASRKWEDGRASRRTEKGQGLELDKRTAGRRGDHFAAEMESVACEGQSTGPGEEAAERKESFFFGRLASRLGLLGELARYSLSG